jgi:hypothetical protein
MRPSAIPIITCTAILATAAACTRQDEQVTSPADAAPEPAPMHTVAGVDDFRMGTAAVETAAVTETKREFAPGETIHFSMAVDDAASGKTVTTYWYGPEERRLAYETKIILPDQERLQFVQDNTADWDSGQYRAEVWVGDEKVGEQQFQIVATG